MNYQVLENSAARRLAAALWRQGPWVWVVALLVGLSAGPSSARAASTYLLGLTNAGGVRLVDTVAGSDGSVYVLGAYTNSNGSAANDLKIGNTTLIRGWQGAEAGFLAKLGPDGGWRWALRLYGSADGVGGKDSGVSALAVTPTGVYVAGVARKGVVIEDTSGVTTNVTANGTNTFGAPYALKFDTNGKLRWGNVAKANITSLCPTCPRQGGEATANDIVADSQGNVYLCGGIPNDSWITFPGVSTSYGFPNLGGAYLVKLNPTGSWQWMAGCGGGGPFRPEFFGLAVDERDRVYVTGQERGAQTDRHYASDGSSVTSLGATVAASVALLARITPAGTWDVWRWLTEHPYTTPNVKGKSVAVVNGKVYQAVEFESNLYIYGGRKLLDGLGGWDVGLVRWTGNLGDVDAVTGITGVSEERIGRHIGFDSLDNIYVAGLFSEPQANFGSNNFVNPPEGTQGGPDVTTSKTNLFVGQLNRDLQWQWVQRGRGLPPNVWKGPPTMALDKLTTRAYVCGGFADGTLALGDDTSVSQLVSGGSGIGWLTALGPDGEFLEQVQLNVLSDFGGREVRPAPGSQTYLRGESISASVPAVLYEDNSGLAIDPNDSGAITARAVTRHTCTGYEVLDTAIVGNSASYGFTIDADTTVRFNWKTEHALDIKNNLTGGAGGLTSTAAGNPDPVVQKHWVDSDTITTTFIDGVIPSPNPNEFGTRYRSTGYFVSGAAGPPAKGILFGGNELNLGPQPSYQPGSNPWTVEFWSRTDAVDAYSRRIINWAPLLYVSQEAGGGGTNLVFSSENSFAGTVTLNTVPLRTGEWHHFAFVNDGAAWTVYYDGDAVVTQPVRAATGTTTNALLLGQFFAGGLDEFRIWNGARSQSQIQQYMQRTLPTVTDPTLLAYWTFDDAATGTVADLKTPAISVPVVAPTRSLNGVLPDRKGIFVPWGSVQSRQQVPQFLMASPAVVEYQWVKENRIQVSVATAALANVPVITGGGVTNLGSGEFWFTNGTAIRVTAPETATAPPETYQLKGFLGGLGNVTTVTGDGTRANGYRYYDIPALTQGSAMAWDYSDRIYKGSVFIGEAINFAAGGSFPTNEMIPGSDMLDATVAPIATTIVSNAPAGSSVDDMRVWDDVADKLYPLRPGVILLEWRRQGGSSSARSVFTQITVAFPTNASFTHIANTPPVPLDQDKTNSVTFLSMKYSERSSTVVSDGAEFSVNDTAFSDPFRTVLLFSERTDGTPANGDLTRERLRVRTVLTKKWDSELALASVMIGTPIASGLQSASVPHNGYVYFEKGRYNAAIYDRTSRQGPIIPVNANPTAKLDEKLVVVWYRTQEGMHWPYQAVQYSAESPSYTANSIVLASRLCSEGLDASGNAQFSFNPGRYTQVSIYNQPDKTLPGYNPNEEHAFIAPSLLHAADAVPPPTAYALRNNLNVTAATDAYTSDPYVLVQYFDTVFTNWNMAVYPVRNDDINLPARRLDFVLDGSSPINVTLGADNVVEFNFAAFQGVTGLRSDEIVNLEVNDNLLDANSGRYFLVRSNDNKFLLSRSLAGPPLTAAAITLSELPRVIVTRAYPYVFEYEMKAGELVQAPYPLQQIIGATPCPATTGENLDPNQFVYWEDFKRQAWAVSGSTNPAAGLRVQFYYPLQPNFWHPTLAPGSCVAYVSNNAPIWVTNHVAWPLNAPTLKAGETLIFSGGEINRDNPNLPGVPGVIGWAAGRVVYDDANPAMSFSRTITNYLARLAAPLTTLQVALPISKVPATLQPPGGKVTVNGTKWFFKELDASLQPRVFYDQALQKLGVLGYVDGKTIGDPALTAAPGSISVLQPNILTARDSNAIINLVASAPADWLIAVSNLVRLSRDPQGAAKGGYGVGLAASGTNGIAPPATQFGPGLALLPNAGLLDPALGLRDGYVTLAENDDPSLGAAPVSLHIIRVKKQPLLRGAIKTLNPPNPFDEKVTLRHSGDFGANAADLVFEWYYKPDDGVTVPPPDLAAPGVWSLLADVSGNNGRGMSEINLAGAGAVTLSDNRFFVRWKHNSGTNWSQWAGAANSRPPGTNELAQNTYVPQLAEGWVKRVIGAINPFDARITDFRNNNLPATYASMVQQAGAPYRGPVALNADQNVVENVGLIELYTTVINRAKGLSIDLSTPITTPAVNNAILLAASRVADFELLLGNEAYTDAQDPTIGFGTASTEYGALAPTIFCFQNQMASLLDEEMALLRGRSEEGAYPAYNRLLWNFTRAEGEAAYALSYNITDQNQDGFINEADARIMFPQGHGDAWGHYLSALRTYYDLLRHPYFNWQARAETLSIEGVVVNVDYLDERKFAQAAAAKAKAGAELVNLTYRSRYVEDPDGQWQGYQDPDAGRAWGVSDWARRAGCGALLDWVTANAILPASDNLKTGIEKVDRTTVKELTQISAQALEIRKQLDGANTGLNPLGLATDVVPFDLEPTTGAGTMHFEQVYDRALKAMGNATDIFNHANQLNNMLRQVAATAEQFAQDAQAQDLDYRNRLIEIFGTPYEGTIGAGKAYPAGYTGPDLYLYMYADVTGIQNVPPPSSDFTAYFGTIPGGFVSTKAPGAGGTSISEVWNHYFTGDAPNISDNTNTDFTSVLELKLPQTASGYSFQAPAEWGSRRSPGQIQQVLSEMVQAEADLQLALHDYDGVIGDIQDSITLIQAHSGLQAESIRLQEKGLIGSISISSSILLADGVAAGLALGAEFAEDTADAVQESLPKVGGFAVDITSVARGATKQAGGVAKNSLKSASFAAERAAHALEGAESIRQIVQDITIQKEEYKYEVQEQLKEFESLLGDEAAKRIEVFRRQEALRMVSDKYRALLDSGVRLMDERELHNKQTGGVTQQNRYQDFTFRIARNDALSKYRAAFDLAARYVYLAAKAYDYETNLDPNDPASARPILTQIIRARTLGALDSGNPRLGSGGLADAMATMKVNFDVLKTQMGFNNPQTETGRFSLRNELFRIAPGPLANGLRDTSTNRVNYDGTLMSAADAWAASDAKWRDTLQNSSGANFTAKVVSDLWQVPEFRRYCRPFAPESAGAQPGLVITFGSQIVFGKNFFGWPLGGGDSSYDPSHFATKVRSVGLWLENYNGEGLSVTPRAYLVPAGVDIMMIPSSADLATREWNVVDQKIPIPLPVSQSNLRDPSWIPLRDSLNGTIAEIRRYSMFRAYHDAGFTTDEMATDSRLVGRSVWNTRWMLVVPGGTLLSSGQEGLDTLIRGRVVPGSSPPTRDGNGVKDIKLFFQTYSYSGN